VPGASRTATIVAATSARGISPRPSFGAAAIRPVPGSSVSAPGRMTV
jgi:hypothetical protein